jgi:hypothetical protein
MRRALASLLLSWFGFSLTVPMLRADADSSVPACCRRLGLHHCTDSAGGESASGPALKAIQVKCSNYPATSAVAGYENFAFLKDSPSIASVFVSFPSLQARAEAQYRISFSRSRQKRGPPAPLA